MWHRLPCALLRECAARNIVIIKPSAMGDVIQSLPILGPLRAHFPQARISWVIRDDLRELVEGHPLLDACLPYRRTGDLKAWRLLLRNLRRQNFDLVLDLQGLFRSGVMSLATGAPIRVGLENSREASRLAHNLSLPDTDREVRAQDRYWRLAQVLGRGDDTQLARLPIYGRDRRWAAEMTCGLRGPLLAIHPGALWETKRWPPARFALVAARAARELGASLVLIGSRSEQAASRHLMSLLRDLVPRATVHDLTGQTGLRQLAALLERVDLLLTGDSGPLHLSAAVGTPVVGLFTATDPGISGPRGRHHTLLRTSSPCRGCYCRACPLSGDNRLRCQRELTVREAWEAVAEALTRHSVRDGSRGVRIPLRREQDGHVVPIADAA